MSEQITEGRILEDLERRARYAIANHDRISAVFFADSLFFGYRSANETINAKYAALLAEAYYLNDEFDRALCFLRSCALIPQYGTFATQNNVIPEKPVLSRSLPDTVFYASPDFDAECSLVAARCLFRLKEWEECASFINKVEASELFSDSMELLASLLCIQGECNEILENSVEAVSCYKKSISIDPLCYFAFDRILNGYLLTESECRQVLVDTEAAYLAKSSLPQSSSWIWDVYRKRLETSTPATTTTTTRTTTRTRTEMKNVSPLSVSQRVFANTSQSEISLAKRYFFHRLVRPCLAITSSFLRSNPFDTTILPLHISACVEMADEDAISELYRWSHSLMKRSPESALTWYSSGCYHFASGRFADARRFFSQATALSPSMLSAWLGFGHTFALSGDIAEPALMAYRSAARLFRGSHLPLLFCGMEYLRIVKSVLPIVPPFSKDGSLPPDITFELEEQKKIDPKVDKTSLSNAELVNLLLSPSARRGTHSEVRTRSEVPTEGETIESPNAPLLAEICLTQSFMQCPQDAASLHELAVGKYLSGQFGEARQLLERAISTFVKGCSSLDKRQYRSVSGFPMSSEPSCFMLGHVYRKLNRMSEALRMYRVAYELNNCAMNACALGFAFQLCKKPSSAIEYYTKALGSDPLCFFASEMMQDALVEEFESADDIFDDEGDNLDSSMNSSSDVSML